MDLLSHVHGMVQLGTDCKTGKLIAFGTQLKDLSSYKVTVESDNVFVEA